MIFFCQIFRVEGFCERALNLCFSFLTPQVEISFRSTCIDDENLYRFTDCKVDASEISAIYQVPPQQPVTQI